MLAQAQLSARRLRPIVTDHKREGRGDLHSATGIRRWGIWWTIGIDLA
jgi:hypothetical protein